MVYVDDEPPLRGEFLRQVCCALERNAVGSLKRAALVLDKEDRTLLSFPPARDTPDFFLKARRKEG
jgi:hypothetical protein